MMPSSLKIHYLQHVPFEDPGFILTWASERGHGITGTRLFEGDRLPAPGSFDMLIIMGGPMGAGDEDRYTWLAGEKRFIGEIIDSGETVLGVCLGAQIIAELLGGRVYRNEHREIGWFPVRLTPEGVSSSVFGILPDKFDAFHWHGDTFTLPPGCVRTVESDACSHQAFEYEGRVFGLQFHLESTPSGIQTLLENGSGDMREGPYVQTVDDILSQASLTSGLNVRAEALLDRIAAIACER